MDNLYLNHTGKTKLQELAEFIETVAKSDDTPHLIEWFINIAHPRLDDDSIGYRGQLKLKEFCKGNFIVRITISFLFSETKGIYNFKLRRSGLIRLPFGKTPTLEQFKDTVNKEFFVYEL